MSKSNHHDKKHKATNGAAHKAFIESAAVAAQQSELLTGVPASITIAQAILESGWGAHHIGEANNYFGVKAQTVKGQVVAGTVAAGYVDVKTREHLKGKDVTIVAHFRKYKSMADSFLDHGLFLKQNNRYHKILVAYSKSGDADAFAVGLQKAGYATDPNYAKLLISIMAHYDLYKFNGVVKKPAS